VLNRIKPFINSIAKKISKRSVLVAIFAVLIVASLILGYFIYNNSTKGGTDKSQTTPLSSEQVTLLIDEVDQLVDDGDNDLAKSKLEGSVDRAADNESKFLLLKNLSSVYYDEENYDEALKTIQTAISTSPESANSSTYDLMAGIYVELGDKKSAIKYYQEAINQLDGEDDWEKNRIESFQEEIDKLQGDANK
jgi:predicted negative regulator of RcsB-dependent stress response